MRWPWNRHTDPLLLPPEEDDDVTDSSDALKRAKAALEQAESNSDVMHRITKAIHRERQANHFSAGMLGAMRRKES